MTTHRAYCLIALSVLATALGASAQTFTTLDIFNHADGANPYYGSLVQAFDGNLYGTTQTGGASNQGTIFRVTPSGTLTSLYSFCALPNCTDGALPYAGMVLGPDGFLYGTTKEGGINFNGCPSNSGCGTVFRFDPNGGGALTTLYQFCSTGAGCLDGVFPEGSLVLVRPGRGSNIITFYGVTSSGGANFDGTAFFIQGGNLSTVYNFCSVGACTDGAQPTGGLIQASDGYFYGTTTFGGTSNNGTVFRLVPEQAGAQETVVHSFSGADGSQPNAAVVQGKDGNLYGTTTVGGGPNVGTVFKVTRGGVFTSLYTFCTSISPCPDGALPYATLIQATDGNLYGTTSQGGSNACFLGCGTIFAITPSGVLSTLYTFQSTDGSDPLGGLVEYTNGTLYGTTNSQQFNPGTLYSLSVSLGSIISVVPAAGRVGAPVTILGTGLTGATKLAFNGSAAKFTVVSDSEITANVPPSATTGKVTVTAQAGTFSTYSSFLVIPVIKSFTPTSGAAGTSVTITGSAFTGATSVTFGVVKATSFTLNSNTQITAIVPSGAVTGKISVTTPGGRATSATVFTVI